MLEIFQKTNLRTINQGDVYSFHDYMDLSSFDKAQYDLRINKDENGGVTFDKCLPVAADEESVALLKKFKSLSLEFVSLTERSEYPITVPSCCRRCFRGQKRTALKVLGKPMFGTIK